MQFVGKITEADLHDVRKQTRARPYWPATSLEAIPKLVFRCCAVIIALASIAAVSAMGALSFGCYGAAKLLEKIRPLRDGYQFLSRTYDRFLDRLGQEVLRDSRDTPALRIMVSLTLTAIPIFVIQLVLGKPRLLLVIAFYLSLYGFKAQRSVRMFSAKHLEAHRPKDTSRINTVRSSAATSNFFLDTCMEIFRNWGGRFMSVSTIKRTAA